MAEAEEPKVPTPADDPPEVFAPPHAVEPEEPPEAPDESSPDPLPPVTPGVVPGPSDLDVAGEAPTLDTGVIDDPRHKAEDDGEEVVPAEAPPPPVPPLIIPEPPPPRERSPIVEPMTPRRTFRLWRTVRRAVVVVLILVLVGPPAAVLVYRVVPPPITWLMVERAFQGQPIVKQWVSLDDIDPSLPNAVIAGEDARFCEHHGFDFQAMRKAMASNVRHPGKLRGGSTISQQTAKNVFLWPGRDYVRKGLEAYFTVLTEALWGKRRIMEMYLNVVEWGPGTYGAQAAARHYFGEPATDIDPGEAARLAAILPSPLKWKAINPGSYVRKRSSRIGAAAGTVRRDGLARCLR